MKTDLSRLRSARHLALAAAVTTSALFMSGCGSTSAPAPGASGAAGTAASSPTARVALTYDGGIAVLDGKSLELRGDIPIEEFIRINSAGDGRHALVTTKAGFRVLDTGTWTDASGSHQAEPKLTDLTFKADTAGHVVRHGGKTVLYADGTGETTIFTTEDLLTAGNSLPETEVVPAEHGHHGVSIVLEDNTLLTTIGNAKSRSGIRVLDADRKEVLRNEECPSVHGEGTTPNEVVIFGCSNGVLVYDGGEITKIPAPDKYGRTGNAYVTDTSTIAVFDYNSDPDLEGYLLEKLALVDTVAKTLKVVELPEGVKYTWRDVTRGPNDEIILLGSDGSLHTLDPATGNVTHSLPVIDAWESPIEWNDPHPALVVLDGIAYVTEPAKKLLHAIDLATGTITSSTELPGAPIEITVVKG